MGKGKGLEERLFPANKIRGGEKVKLLAGIKYDLIGTGFAGCNILILKRDVHQRGDWSP